MLCSCVAVAVGALAGWHIILISRGETSVEVYINRNTKKKMKKEGKVSFKCLLLVVLNTGPRVYIQTWQTGKSLDRGRTRTRELWLE